MNIIDDNHIVAVDRTNTKPNSIIDQNRVTKAIGERSTRIVLAQTSQDAPLRPEKRTKRTYLILRRSRSNLRVNRNSFGQPR